MKNTLTATDWIKASFRALTKGGPQAIKAEAIARALKVSKGSFYWHFKNVPALKSAMLDHWVEIGTNNIIHIVRKNPADPAAQLRLLMQISTDERSADYGGNQADPAIRDWARYDANAAKALRLVDTKRLAFVTALFLAYGHAEPQAKTSADILYAALIGLEGLSFHGLGDPKIALPVLLETLLSQRWLHGPRSPKFKIMHR
ncbi:MAG: TetR/AcrR family transcriptional regulator [Rhodobacteraceae bacterium]|nr:TetR/AcrR family transcriptional regulator [Paracoccaceae bacterium]